MKNLRSIEQIELKIVTKMTETSDLNKRKFWEGVLYKIQKRYLLTQMWDLFKDYNRRDWKYGED